MGFRSLVAGLLQAAANRVQPTSNTMTRNGEPVVSALVVTIQLFASAAGFILDVMMFLTLRPSKVTSTQLGNLEKTQARAMAPKLVYNGTPVIPALFWAYFGIIVIVAVFNWGVTGILLQRRLGRHDGNNEFKRWIDNVEITGTKWVTGLTWLVCFLGVANLNIMQCRAWDKGFLAAPIETDRFWMNLGKWGLFQAVMNLAKLGLQIFFRVQFDGLWPLIKENHLIFASWTNVVMLVTLAVSGVTTVLNMFVSLITIMAQQPSDERTPLVDPPSQTWGEWVWSLWNGSYR
ncbi:hypothetical protein AMAG_12374 [Allomyces macrogynus ATCC 38327]|uniref:Uncharacterized protein n=1 Tax=Allomyces macrogynus (strain ATCC 38327) TaxID=578462 RepID=A0A0L0SXL8_ALLM3|nr:hypothetical protein AMAG_12374 [Allomyces macrogynus ATCC 38327]|eukprot:KNE67308.1 hypothetical protein AMAG_12374 [Allomyces macrogynus ATCC 38327]